MIKNLCKLSFLLFFAHNHKKRYLDSDENFEIELSEYDVLSTGADGGHKYASTEIIQNGKFRRMIIFFKNKRDEVLLDGKNILKVRGKLFDEGFEQILILNDIEVIKYI